MISLTTPVALATACAALAVGMAVWLIWTAVDPTRRQVRENLRRAGVTLVVAPNGPGPNESSFSLSSLARRVTPEVIVKTLDRQHTLAGRPAAWTVEKLLTLKLLWLLAAGVVSALILLSGPPPLMVLMTLGVSVVGYFVPELLLNSEGTKRNQQIELELADTLDQMTIAVEAGLGFDSAMARAAQNGKGPLANELVRTLQDIQMGNSRRQAFEALTVRTTVVDLRRFVRAVIQADAYGVSIASVLRTQADEMRLKRRQRAEEKAQKIPVKVLMPLMLFILPVIFIVVMGPAAINIVDSFSGM
ncbi:type II secretion system F family protein [Nesterenkonia sp. LB17]|uniref:type II secretion system F family protein n=1 Tax=Nesterenkonia sp. LB17 TaxID=2901230 RepID=UPI001F4CCF3D|nr:type II secretion system F family protein [Nesterenkonia sp. LB17]MCH8566093.1 type II secretion system F family protein [Nesterenkonia sp. LB17]